MISRDLELNINNDKASLNESVTIYMYDRGIKLDITIKNKKFNIGYTSSVNMLEDNPEIYMASTIIKSPDGKIFKHPAVKTEILNNKLTIIITKEWANELSEVGDYEVQIQLFGDDDSRITLPSFKIKVAKPLFPYDDGQGENIPGYTDNSEFDSAIVGQEYDIVDNSNIVSGDYDQTNWVSNMIISKEALNKIETRLDEVYSGDGAKLTIIPNLNTEEKTIINAINELSSLFNSLKLKVETFVGGEIMPEVPEVPEVLPITNITINGGYSQFTTSEELFALTASLIPSNTDQTDVIWECLTPDVADIDFSGLNCVVRRKLKNETAIITCTSKYNYNVHSTVYITFSAIDYSEYDVVYTVSPAYKRTLYFNEIDVTRDVETLEVDYNSDVAICAFKYPEKMENISFARNTGITNLLKFNGTPSSCKNMFLGCSSLERIDAEIDCSKVKDLTQMFYDCYSLTEIPDLDVSSATDFLAMFHRCTSLASLDLSSWDTSNAETMMSLFDGCSSLTEVNLDGWDTTNVKDMTYMFEDCSSLTNIIGIENLQLDNAASISSMFRNCSSIETLDLSNWDISNVRNIGYLFQGCSSFTSANISNWNIKNINNVTCMFDGCSSLVSIDLSNWVPENLYRSASMFRDCTSLESFPNLDVTQISTLDSMFENCINLTGVVDADVYWNNSFKHGTKCFLNCTNLNNYNEIPSTWGGGYVVAESCIMNDGNTIVLTDSDTVTVVAKITPATARIEDLIFTDTSDNVDITIGSGVVENDTLLLNIEVTNNEGLGNEVSTIITAQSDLNKNLETNTVTVQFAYNEYSGYDIVFAKPYSENSVALLRINDPDNETGISEEAAMISVNEENNTAVYAFSGSEEITSVNFNVTDNNGLYINSDMVEVIKLPKTLTNTSYMFQGCSNLETLPEIDISECESAKLMFDGCSNARKLTIKASSTPNVENIFNGCIRLNEIICKDVNTVYIVSEWLPGTNGTILSEEAITDPILVSTITDKGWQTDNTDLGVNDVNNYSIVFKCNGYPESMVVDGKDITTEDLFTINGNLCYGYKTKIRSVRFPKNVTHVLKLDVSNITEMAYMFYNCDSLVYVNTNDWDTSNVISMNYMFYYCSSLTSLDVSNWNVDNVIYISSMFEGCRSLTSLDLSKWSINGVDNMIAAFNGCRSLTSLDLSNWNVDNTRMMTYLLSNCDSLTSVNLDNWNITTNMIKDNNRPEVGTLFENSVNLKEVKMNIASSIEAVANSLPSREGNEIGIILTEVKEADINTDTLDMLNSKYWIMATEHILPITNLAINSDLVEGDILDIPVDYSVQLSVSIEPENYMNDNYTWYSSNTEVATISEDGILTTHSAGYCDIWAESDARSVKSNVIKCEVHNYITSIEITNPEILEDIRIEDEKQLEVITQPSNAEDVIQWKIKNGLGARVTDGLITAIAGLANEVYAYSKYARSQIIQFTPYLYYIKKMNIESGQLDLDVGQSTNLKLTILPNGYKETYSWHTTDTNVARVDQNGVVTAVGAGTCEIYTESNERLIESNNRILCNVTDSFIPIDTIAINNETLEYFVGDVIRIDDLSISTTPNNHTDQYILASGTRDIVDYDETKDGLVVKQGGNFQIYAVTSTGLMSNIVNGFARNYIRSMKVTSYENEPLFPGNVVDLSVDILPENYTGDSFSWVIDESNSILLPNNDSDTEAKLYISKPGNIVAYTKAESGLVSNKFIATVSDGISVVHYPKLTSASLIYIDITKNDAFTLYDTTHYIIDDEVIFDGNNRIVDNAGVAYTNYKPTLGMTFRNSKSQLERILLVNGVEKLSSFSSLFENCSNLKSVNGIGWDTSNINTMSSMFKNCSSLTDIYGINEWNVESVSNMHSMFEGCTSLGNSLDLSNWKLKSSPSMGRMFANTTFEELHIENWSLGYYGTGETSDATIFEGNTNLRTIYCNNAYFIAGLVTFSLGTVNGGYIYTTADCSSHTINEAANKGWNIVKI